MLEGFLAEWYEPQCVIIEVLCALQVFTTFRRFQGPNYTTIQNQPERVHEKSILFPFSTTCLHLVSMFATEYKYYEKISGEGRADLIPAVRNIHFLVIFMHALLLHLACIPSRERFIELLGGIQMFRIFFMFFISFAWFMSYSLVFSTFILNFMLS